MLLHLLIVGHKAMTMRHVRQIEWGTSNNKRSSLLLFSIFVVAAHVIHVAMMLLNVFQKQSPTSELYIQYTPYSFAFPIGGTFWKSGYFGRFMICQAPDFQMELRVQNHL